MPLLAQASFSSTCAPNTPVPSHATSNKIVQGHTGKSMLIHGHSSDLWHMLLSLCLSTFKLQFRQHREVPFQMVEFNCNPIHSFVLHWFLRNLKSQTSYQLWITWSAPLLCITFVDSKTRNQKCVQTSWPALHDHNQLKNAYCKICSIAWPVWVPTSKCNTSLSSSDQHVWSSKCSNGENLTLLP